MATLEEQLSLVVQKYPILFDKTNKDFHRKDLKINAWSMVAEELNLEDGEEAEKQFHKLRDRYTRAKKAVLEQNKSENPSKAALQKAKEKMTRLQYVQWLDDFIKHRRTRNHTATDFSYYDDDDFIGEDDQASKLSSNEALSVDESNYDADSILAEREDFKPNPVKCLNNFRLKPIHPKEGLKLTINSEVLSVEDESKYDEDDLSPRKLFKPNPVRCLNSFRPNTVQQKETLKLSLSNRAMSNEEANYDNDNTLEKERPQSDPGQQPIEEIRYHDVQPNPLKRKPSQQVNGAVTEGFNIQKSVESAAPEFSKKRYFNLEASKKDHFDIFGDYVASKMKKLSSALSDEAIEEVEFNITSVLLKARSQNINPSV